MDSGIQKTAEDDKGNRRAGGAAHKAPRANRPGRKQKEVEPGINDANLFRIINHVFPRFLESLDGLTDFRVKGRCTYSVSELLQPAIVSRLVGNRSSRQLERDKNDTLLAANLRRLGRGVAETIPHSDTIKHFFEGSNSKVLGACLPWTFEELLRSRRVYGMQCAPPLNGGKPAFTVAIDGVHYYTSSRELDHSTHVTHSNGKTEYQLVALQASVVCSRGITLPLMVEFIENPKGNYDKQDCELKACRRLMGRLKKRFPHLSIIVLMDGLYFCENILNLCARYNWKCSITVTDRVSAFMKEAEEKLAGGEACSVKTDQREVRWCSMVKHKFGKTEFSLNVIRVDGVNQKGEKIRLYYATTINLTRKAETVLRILDEICRARWQIEETFDILKNHGFELKAAFGTKGYAGQNYYLVVQLAYLFLTLMKHTNLFRRLQQRENPGWFPEVLQTPMMEWYGSIANLMQRLKMALLCRIVDDFDMTGWRLKFDTA